ncbi:MAG: DNA cytosine methyltransferase, partial [bacterium]
MQTTDSNHRLEAVSLFSGGGGMDLGLDATGWINGFCTDIDPHSVITLQWGRAEAARRGKHILAESIIFRSDIKELTASFILEAIGRKKGEVHLLAGGPPCQAFSVFGKRKGRKDNRGLLAYEYLRLLAELQPEAFVFENVYGIMTVEDGEVFAEIRKQINDRMNILFAAW